MEKALPSNALFHAVGRHLFDFVFLEFDMLAHNRIIFFHDHFFGHGARVFLRNIIKARSSRAFQFDFNGCRLRHCVCPENASGLATSPPKIGVFANMSTHIGLKLGNDRLTAFKFDERRGRRKPLFKRQLHAFFHNIQNLTGYRGQVQLAGLRDGQPV